ncbi:unnamed protein product [Cyprideis torosa]|uniref:Uncharacterized protein n=1 Tax=Cyprideis torosa TaxID=163714 RepID=A0A7R8ZIL2_9CRUS|nr:unnamed protein product [Cyprideis torosa]CAG0880223.1 unnamed protein product [Cyprideis torosa]
MDSAGTSSHTPAMMDPSKRAGDTSSQRSSKRKRYLLSPEQGKPSWYVECRRQFESLLQDHKSALTKTSVAAIFCQALEAAEETLEPFIVEEDDVVSSTLQRIEQKVNNLEISHLHQSQARAQNPASYANRLKATPGNITFELTMMIGKGTRDDDATFNETKGSLKQILRNAVPDLKILQVRQSRRGNVVLTFPTVEDKNKAKVAMKEHQDTKMTEIRDQEEQKIALKIGGTPGVEKDIHDSLAHHESALQWCDTQARRTGWRAGDGEEIVDLERWLHPADTIDFDLHIDDSNIAKEFANDKASGLTSDEELICFTDASKLEENGSDLLRMSKKILSDAPSFNTILRRYHNKISRYADRRLVKQAYHRQRDLAELSGFLLHADFQGRELKIGMARSSPWWVIKKENTSKTPIVTYNEVKGKNVAQTEVFYADGIDAEILRTLAKQLNFTYRMFLSSDGSWGWPGPGNVFTGMIGDVQADLVDMAISAITITEIRSRVVSFTNPYFFDQNVLASKAPTPTAMLSTVFFDYIWIMVLIFISLVLCGLILWLTGTFGVDSPKVFAIGHALVTVTRVLTNQSVAPRTGTAGRFVMAGWIIGSFFIYALCAGLFVSLLTTTKLSATVDTLEQLEKGVLAGVLKMHVMTFSSIYTLFEQSKEGSIYANIFKGLLSKDLVDLETADKLAQDDPTIIMVEPLSMAMERNPDIWYLGKERFFSDYYGVVLPKGSPHMDEFNKQIGHLHSSGLLWKWADMWKKKHEHIDTGADDQSGKSLSLETLQGAFYVLLIGQGLGIVAFILEILHQRLTQRYLQWPLTFRIHNLFQLW